MFENLHEVYPEAKNLWVLESRLIENNKIVVPYQILLDRFGDEKLIKIINNCDPHWICYERIVD